jgi:hypothetical protein
MSECIASDALFSTSTVLKAIPEPVNLQEHYRNGLDRAALIISAASESGCK